MRGRFYCAQTHLQTAVHVMDAYKCIEDPAGTFLDGCSPKEYEKLKGEKNQYYIIGDDKKVYRVSKNEVPEVDFVNNVLKDGDPVSFETPATQRGKFRWAYDIQQVA